MALKHDIQRRLLLGVAIFVLAHAATLLFLLPPAPVAQLIFLLGSTAAEPAVSSFWGCVLSVMTADLALRFSLVLLKVGGSRCHESGV